LSAYQKRGASICSNGLKMPIGRVDDAVIKALVGRDVLRPAMAQAIVGGVFTTLQAARNMAALGHREALAKLIGASGNMAAAMAETGDLAPLLEHLEAAANQTRRVPRMIAALEAVLSLLSLIARRRVVPHRRLPRVSGWSCEGESRRAVLPL
jgi:uncharacterized membrane protein YjfL (UPF0719 family)